MAGVLAMLSPNCGIEFGNMSDSTFETGNVRKIPMLKNKKVFGNDPFKNNFREADLGWLAD